MSGVFNNIDHSEKLAEQVRVAFEESTPLCVTGSGSKLLQGLPVKGTPVNVFEHQGVTEYESSELVITARAGTPLAEIETQLAEAGQMLPFEPPHLGEGATLGGTIACGVSGPRRPYTIAARDAVLGVRMINGRGETLTFGGQVMKNVAGYDVSRLMVGAQGTLGVLLDVSIKVLPVPECDSTLCLNMGASDAIEKMNQWASKPIPLSAACYLPHVDGKNEGVKEGGQLWVRLSGVESAVKAAAQKIGGEKIETGQQFWLDLREQNLAFFKQTDAVWRLSLPPASPPLTLSGSCLIDWGGAQRWLVTPASKDEVQQVASALGGYAILYDSHGAELPPLASGLRVIHQRVKDAFDPNGILNPGRLYKGL